MTFIFDGREFARHKEEELKNKVDKLKLKPKLVSIIIGADPASILYVGLKKKAAERIGAELEIVNLPEDTDKEEILKIINRENKNPKVNGIMLQLPLPPKFISKDRDEIIASISNAKDIDGLKEESLYVPPTAKAVLSIFIEAEDFIRIKDYPGVIAVIGGRGFIGSQIVRVLEKMHKNSYKIVMADRSTTDLKGLTLNSDIIISVTGVPGLIRKDMVKKTSVLIDVGSPSGDVEKDAYENAVFVSPVPGGVGPVTISSLMENLVDSAEKVREIK